MIRIPARQARAWLLIVVAAEMLAAAYLRWPLTTAAIQTQFEYQLGQVVITSENWHREGVFARHFLPTRSTDAGLTEWSSYDQDYVTVPPLSFLAHYVAARLFPRIEPVLLAKLVAQVQIFVGLLIASACLYATFSFWPTLLAMSFLIWTTPFLVWFINGYFPTTTALLLQLVFIAWFLPRVRRWANGRSTFSTRDLWIGAGLAALGACTEALDLAVIALISLCLVVMGLMSRRARLEGRRWFVLAGAIAGGAAGTIAAIVGLYATVTDFGATFSDRFARRSGTFSGRVGVAAHAQVVWRQMQTAWPKALLVGLACGAALITVWILWTMISTRGAGRRIRRGQASVFVVALLLGLGPSLVYHYVLQNHVTIHWWFAGTWAIGGALVLAICAVLARRLLFACWRDRRVLRVVYPAVCATLAVASTVAYAASTDLPRWSSTLAVDLPMNVYRDLGEQLPRDRYPLIATHFADADLFTHYPFATAYVRRPIVLLDRGVLTLPWGDVPADVGRLRQEKYAYVAYNPFGRRCRGDAVPLGDWHVAWMRVCRVEMDALLGERDAILEPRSPAEPIDMAHAAVPEREAPGSQSSGHTDQLLADLQARIAAGGRLTSRAELMALARVVRTRGWSDETFLRRVLDRADDAPELAEPIALLRAEHRSGLADPSLPGDVIRAGRGGVLSPDMHGDAVLEGFTVHPGPRGYLDVTVYFRPLREWSGRQLWLHAYPAGSQDYVSFVAYPQAYAGWKPGELAWEGFLIPAHTRYNAFVGVGVGGTLGNAYPLGWLTQ